MKVCKFGGSSVADAAQILKVLEIVRSDAQRRVVVVSAPGKRAKGDDKVTDLLIACAQDALAGRDWAESAGRVEARYESIRADLGLDEALVAALRGELAARLSADRSHPGAFEDAVKALGEEFSARFCAAAFSARGLPAVYVDPRDAGMLLSEEFGAAQLLPESYDRLRAKLSPIPDVVVFPGFYGYTASGRLATFSRGGSDITGAILAAALRADVYENFTDVDAVYPVDPRLCPEAAKGEGIKEMTFAEMRELSYAGFAVFHDEAVMPAIRAKIPINIRNTNRPDEPGTMVVPRRRAVPGRVNGIASSGGFGALYVEKWLMNREVGFGRALLMGLGQALALLPGVSRSGMTLASARGGKVDPEKSAEFSFLMSAPLILGGMVLEVLKEMRQIHLRPLDSLGWGDLAVGAAVAAVVGYFSLALLVKALKGKWFWLFGPYCLVAGLLTLLLT